MKKNLTEMVFILDRSGSMSHLTQDTIGGFNSMIEQQKKEDGEAYVTTVLFNGAYEFLHDHVNIQDLKPITEDDYVTYGMTAMYDAIGKTIDAIGERLSSTPEEERPEKVIFVITTDGQENSSKAYTSSKIRQMIQHQQDKYNWTFIFLGANINAEEEGSKLGIKNGYSKTYTASTSGTGSVYRAMSSTMSSVRSVDTSSCTSATLDSLVVESLKDIE